MHLQFRELYFMVRLGDAGRMELTPLLSASLSGLVLGLALIAAIGPQNVFVLRQGLRGEHVGSVVAICVVSDLVLIGAVTSAAGMVSELPAAALTAVRWAGVLYLAVFAASAARRAVHPSAVEIATSGRSRRATVVGTTLALTWLNPHIYVDMVLVVGPLAASHGEGRWAFGTGVLIASTLWFLALGLGARVLRPLFRRPATWRLVDAGVAVTMAVLAVALARTGSL